MQSFHLRGDLDDVAEVVTQFLVAEGFSLTDRQDASDPSVRRIAFYADAGWVGLAEENFSATEWGPVLSEALRTEVVTLAGECDHAFYTHVFVHENGAQKHAARVPEDITLDDDGQHRLRTKFLPGPIVVDELGGEGNMQLIGELMGIPKPRFSIWDDAPALTLALTYTSDAPPKKPDFAKLFGAEFAGMADEIQSALNGLKVQLAPGMRAMMGVRATKTDGAPRLVACQESNSHDAFAGESGHVWASFLLEDAESAKGLSVSLYGEGLVLFEPARIRARAGDREWTALPAIEDGLVKFALPEVELSQPAARPDTSHLPLEERMRQGMKRLGAMSFGANRAEVTVWIEGRFLEPGFGELALTASLQGSAATTDLTLKVKPAVRRPHVPSSAETPHPVYVEAYESRRVAFGWVAFDAPWSEVKDTVLAIAREAQQVLQEATGSRAVTAHAHARSGKRLTLNGDIWARADAALAEGADLSVHLDKSLNGAAIELAHQIDGPNLIPTLTWREKRPPAVWLAWWCPQPESEAGLRALARLGERTLELAAKLPSNVGGLVSAQGEYSRGMFDTAYDRIANLQGTTDVKWLKTHARAPGWRVLLPPGLRDERLIKSPAPNPFAYSSADAEAMERLIVPLMG